jgi:beta-barrel assembly-enhancing protease
MGNLGRVLGTLGSRISRSGYSQELETEADLVGLGLMAKAGYDPSEALKLFEHLEKERDEENMREPFFFGTHPRLRKRMENCNNFLKKNFKRSETQPKKTEVFYEKTHKLILHNAWLDLKAGRFRSAQRGAEKYLRFKPDEARPYYLLGEIFRQRGGKNDNKKAKAYYGTAIALDPSYPDIHKAIGLVYYKEGKMRLAKRSFETCLSLSHQRQDEAYILGYLEQCNR